MHVVLCTYLFSNLHVHVMERVSAAQDHLPEEFLSLELPQLGFEPVCN